jgi:hypothetical protein
MVPSHAEIMGVSIGGEKSSRFLEFLEGQAQSKPEYKD